MIETMKLNSSANMFDPEAQAEIQRRIDLERHEVERKKAEEENPEFLIRTCMLYVPMEIKGNKINAFIDTGAQSTIMSKRFANDLGILKLVDERFKGKAVGVGSCEIVGRIHALDIVINNVTVKCAITVLGDDRMKFLFGLDNMKRHRCSVDLLENKLKFPELGMAVDFLKEHEIGEEDFSTPQISGNKSENSEDKIKQFMGISNLDYNAAKKKLEDYGWD